MITLISIVIGLTELTKYEDATWLVESSRKEGMIWGDQGRSLGPLQISKACWQDALEFDPSIGGTYLDCQHLDYSIKIMRAYLARYCTERRLGRKPTDFDRARTWVGGPRGPWRESSIPYAKKIMGAMK
mgnify:FL=1